MSILKKIVFGLVVLGLAVLAFFYSGTFSEGTRAGVVTKISQRGVIFKTWEGQMSLKTFGAIQSDNMVSDTYKFSIEKGNAALIKELQDAALSGERVNLLYKERYMTVPWRGDTKVFAVGVERRPEQD
jgi:hypothetical protein